ncbi:MAG: imidazole glycerol phosphate synthase subunit HisH [Gammaproteobacteria bacterium]|nr:MAG: imidazole glycerol phosphate synthase subunit HisH [Gammaproteobacteria bacterium]
MDTIAVIDYGMGNLRSVAKALEHVAPDVQVLVTSEAGHIESAEKVVFPGVGAIRDCVHELDRLGIRDVLIKAAGEKPFLGICLGMQALMTHSEENNGTEGLGFIAGEVPRFAQNLSDASGQRLKVPHMGWNRVAHTRPHPLWDGIAPEERFYFVHSYYVRPDDPDLVTGSTDYGGAFASAIGYENLFAVQFHPEKSQKAGLALLANFAAWDGRA